MRAHRDHRGSALDDSALPDDVVLEDVTGRVDRDGIGAHWRLKQSRGGPDALPAVLGMRRMHQIRGEGAVRADLVSDGPHALVAGTTGSGKSELLIAWLFQLALDLPPSRLALILVDYKGGAAFGPLADLPHTAGVLTDLDPAATARALASLEAEVQRRERLLARAGAKDVTALSSTMGPAKGSTRGSTSSVQAPPRLVVVVDEFATLASHASRYPGFPRACGRPGPQPGNPPDPGHTAARRSSFTGHSCQYDAARMPKSP